MSVELTENLRHTSTMSMAEIQEAIQKLPSDEQTTLAVWLWSQAGAELSPAEEGELLASLDKAAEQLDSGQGVPLQELRPMIKRWSTN